MNPHHHTWWHGHSIPLAQYSSPISTRRTIWPILVWLFCRSTNLQRDLSQRPRRYWGDQARLFFIFVGRYTYMQTIKQAWHKDLCQACFIIKDIRFVVRTGAIDFGVGCWIFDTVFSHFDVTFALGSAVEFWQLFFSSLCGCEVVCFMFCYWILTLFLILRCDVV